MDTIVANSIKKCKKCFKSKEQGAVFGFSKPYNSPLNQNIIRYENLACNECLALNAKEYRKNNLEKVKETKKKRRNKLHGTILYHVQNKISSYKKEAKKSNLPFDLTVGHLVEMFENQNGLCFYSKKKLIFGYVNGKIHHNSISLDKIDPQKGYTVGNVVWCSYLVNTMKQNLTKEEFFENIKNILINNGYN